MRILSHTLDADARLEAAIDRIWSRRRPLFADPAKVAGLDEAPARGPERDAAFIAFIAVANTCATFERLRSGRRIHPVRRDRNCGR